MLWDDIFFSLFPDNDYQKFKQNNEYYLGSIVTFKNENGKLEVIDSQQLLPRVFYANYFKKYSCLPDTYYVCCVRYDLLAVFRLKVFYKCSIADAISLATAIEFSGKFVTSDHHELEAVEKSEAISFP